MFISGGEEGIILWNYNLNNSDPNKISKILSINELDCKWNNSMCRLDDDRIIINGSNEGLLKVISISKMKIIKEIENPFLCYGIKLIKNKGIFLVGGDGIQLVGGKKIYDIRIYNSDNYEYIDTIENAHDDNIFGFVELKDGRIASYSDDAKIKIWEFNI